MYAERFQHLSCRTSVVNRWLYCRRVNRHTTALILLALVSLSLNGAQPPAYHLELEANPAAPFPFLGKFGTVDLDVYSGGVRAETLWLNGFSRNGSRAITVENPFGRMYTEVPTHDLSAILKRLAGNSVAELRAATPVVSLPVRGKVHGIDANRYRLVYGASAWIDIWTTTVVPQNPQFRAIIDQFVTAISPPSAASLARVSGTPVYVELNFRRFKKVPLLRLKSLARDNRGEESALKVGTLYFRAPMLDAIWK